MHGLQFTAGPLAGHRVEVTSALVLGREGADLVIEDPQVSRRHASVRPAGDGLEIEDLGSLNGTWVNGARVTGEGPAGPRRPGAGRRLLLRGRGRGGGDRRPRGPHGGRPGTGPGASARVQPDPRSVRLGAGPRWRPGA